MTNDLERLNAAQRDSNRLNENNDCAVVAVAMATGHSYSEVHPVFTDYGRRHRRASRADWKIGALTTLGFHAREVEFSSKTPVTLARELANGTYLVKVRSHVMCIKEGQILDCANAARRRIRKVYEVYRTPRNRQTSWTQLELL